MPDVQHMLILPVIGLLAGVLGGLLGIGGGLIIIPMLIITLGNAYGVGSLHVYKIAALATAIVLSIPAARQHLRSGAVVKRMLPSIELFGVLGVILGVALASLLAGDLTLWLQRIFGGCMIAFVVAQRVLRRAMNVGSSGAGGIDRRVSPLPSRWMLIGTRVGLPSGVISGLLGIGGGVWAVPAQNLWLGIRLQSAIANSTCMIVGVAISAAIFQSIAVARMSDLNWTDGWLLALFLSPGAILGGSLGGRLTHILPVNTLRLIFDGVLILTGVRLLL
ncbi:MAG: sulfite exporter TauE/SafE family protein [Phycisphaerae bacterium]